MKKKLYKFIDLGGRKKYKKNMFQRNKSTLQLCIAAIFTLSLGLASFTGMGNAFEQIIKETSPVENLRVKVSYDKGVFWRVDLQNQDLKLPLTILWDKSSYLSSSGRSSRLVHEKNITLHPAEKQVPSTILAQQKATILFTSEDLLPYAEKNIAPIPSGSGAQGYLTLAVKKNGTQFFWKSTIQFIY